MFTILTKTAREGRKASRVYRHAVDRSIGLDQTRTQALVDDVFRLPIR